MRYGLFLILLIAALMLLAYSRNEFVAECVKSGNTATYCEYLFWK